MFEIIAVFIGYKSMRPTRMSISAKYYGSRCRLDFHVPQGKRFIPLNLRDWTAWEEAHVRVQHTNDGLIDIGIYNSSFKPFRPLDLIIAGQAIADKQVEAVVLAPHDNVVLKSLEIMAKFCWPLFSVTDQKQDRSPEEMVDLLMRLNTMNQRCNVQFNWISSSDDAAVYMIAQVVGRGEMNVNRAIDRFIGPGVGNLIYYYFNGEEKHIVDILAEAEGRVRLIELSEDFYPLLRSPARLTRDGLLNCGLISSPNGPALTFEMPVDNYLH